MKYGYISKILYHGTSSLNDFENKGYGTPTGPAWFSDGIGVAMYFKSCGSGPLPRILKYRVVVRPNLFKFKSMRALARLAGIRKEDYVLEENLNNYEPGFWVKVVCSAGYDGWIIPDNYPEFGMENGADIMICQPEKFLTPVWP